MVLEYIGAVILVASVYRCRCHPSLWGDMLDAVLNLVGSVFLMVAASMSWHYGFGMLNYIWAGVSVAQIMILRRQRLQPKDKCKHQKLAFDGRGRAQCEQCGQEFMAALSTTNPLVPVASSGKWSETYIKECCTRWEIK